MAKINVAVIGVGSFGAKHAATLHANDRVNLVAVCDADAEAAKKCGEDCKVPYFTDYNEVLKNSEIEAVCVVTPDFLHRDIVVAALEAGKHVLCEKPLALNLEDCKVMIAAAKKTDKVFMVGQICRYTPSFKAVKEIIDRGEIGELFFIESEYAHDYSHMPKDSWRLHPDRHGLIGGGCHAVDLIRWLAGDPEEVFGYGNQKVLTDWPTNDCTVGIMKFKDGVVGKVFCSTGCKRGYTMRTVIYGTKGTIIVDNTSPFYTVYKAGEGEDEMMYGLHRYGIGIQVPVVVNNHNIAHEHNDFLDCIESGGQSKINGIEGASTVSVCTAIVKACETGMPQKVDYNF